MEEKKKLNIDIHEIITTLWAKKKSFLKVWIITFVLSCIWILPQPRYYTCKVLLAPETSNSKLEGMSSLASSFGFNMGGISEDAIYPTLYPDLFESTEFITSLFNIQIKTKDGKIHTDYYNYMAKYQQENWLIWPFLYTVNKLKELSGAPLSKPGSGKDVNPFMLSKFDSDLVKNIGQKIDCSVDKKTDVITINVTDQDPLVCATLADSIREHLQDYITNYRTHKIRIDIRHYQQVVDSAFIEYRAAVKRYSAFCDANSDVSLQSVISKRDELENDMQLKYNTYSTMYTRLDASKVKLQENTPAFTTLLNATVPLKPAGPKRMIFVGVMLVLATIVYSAWLIKKNAKNIIF